MSHLRISSTPVSSDLIPYGKADIIISVEPMESLRYLDYLSPEGWVITNTKPFENINHYPDFDKLMQSIRALPHRIFVDAEQMAHEVGSVKASNMVMLGAALPFLKLSEKSVNEAVQNLFSSKGEQVVVLNLKAIQLGNEYALNSLK